MNVVAQAIEGTLVTGAIYGLVGVGFVLLFRASKVLSFTQGGFVLLGAFIFYDFVREDRVMTISPAWSSESVRRFFDAGGEHGEIMKAANVPPAFVIIQRINLGLYAVLGELGATANWRRITEEIWPWYRRPPSTPLGEQEAAWLAGSAG